MNYKQLSPFIFAIVIFNLNLACSKARIEDAPLLPKSITCFIEDEISSVTEFTYDNENKIIEEKKSIITDDAYNSLNLFRYNVAGKIVKREYFSNQGYSNYTTFEYDSSGKIISQARYEEEDRLAYYRVYFYNGVNQVDSVFMYSSDSIKNGVIYFNYDIRGNRIQEQSIYFSNSGSEEWKSKFYEFDDKPNIFSGLKYYYPEKVFKNNRIKQFYPTSGYYEGNRLIAEIDENTPFDNYIYEYNDKGYPIKITKEGSSIYEVIEYNN